MSTEARAEQVRNLARHADARSRLFEDDPQAADALPASLDTFNLATMELLDPGSVDWPRVARTAYLINQHLRYEYPGPIHDLEQRLMILPPAHHGDQRRVMYRLELSQPVLERTDEEDGFGNTVINLSYLEVRRAIDFEAWIVLERHAAHGPLLLPAAALQDRRLRELTLLTAADPAVRAAAAELAASGDQGQALAERIGAWTYQALTYAYDITSIHTTASEALAVRGGVCQDYAHLMLALCRLCGLPARYVSGHLLGVGGTHAWVEVMLPDPERDGAIAWPYDPANGCVAGLRYITIAVGRDYHDVAPTSGTFRASFAGTLRTYKSVGLTAADYAPAAR